MPFSARLRLNNQGMKVARCVFRKKDKKGIIEFMKMLRKCGGRITFRLRDRPFSTYARVVR